MFLMYNLYNITFIMYNIEHLKKKKDVYFLIYTLLQIRCSAILNTNGIGIQHELFMKLYIVPREMKPHL